MRLGVKAKDVVSGLEGIITARCQYLNGCVQYCLTPSVGADGKKPDSFYIDEGQIVETGPGISVPEPLRAVGGPQSDAPSTSYRP